MANFKFTKFHVKNFRSINNIEIDINNDKPVIICGENNIGKTNFLRALNIFFNYITNNSLYDAKIDIPYHIYYGSRGGGTKTTMIGEFEKTEADKTTKIKLEIIFKSDNTVLYKENNTLIDNDSATNILSNFKFIFIESNNINIPILISEVLENEGLMSLDSKRSKQSAPLTKLTEFITLSQDALKSIEKDINTIFKTLTNFDGILKTAEIKIKFAEFEKLRDAIKTMTSITLFDGSNHEIESKGSGAQRAVFLSLMQYISSNIKKNIIWGIDEPEVFLQPKLQKQVAKVINTIVSEKNQPVILTTHSQHFINLYSLKSTHLFIGEKNKKKYERKPGKTFCEIITSIYPNKYNSDKYSQIKNHLGIEDNDGWNVLPYNVLVEGPTDKTYITELLKLKQYNIPQIVYSGGASKIGGYMEFYNNFVKDHKSSIFKPKVICIFDYDKEGKDQKQKIKPSVVKNVDVSAIHLPKLTTSDEYAIEDFIPSSIMFEVINRLLTKKSYKKISSKQFKNKQSLANAKKQLLPYATECTSSNNPENERLDFTKDGLKQQLCQIFQDLCKKDSDFILKHLSKEHNEFLLTISNESICFPSQ